MRRRVPASRRIFLLSPARCDLIAAQSSSSSGDATLWVVQSLTANSSSSGNVAYYGSPTLSQHTSSSGRVIGMGSK